MEYVNVETVSWIPDDGIIPAAAGPVPDYEVDPADVTVFRRDGVVLVKGAFSDWVDDLRSGLERNLSNPQTYAFPCESTTPDEPGRFFDSYCNWARIPEYRRYVMESCAASMAGQFMGSSRAQFFHEHCFVKEPGTHKATPWHHDLSYYCVDGAETVSIYVALDPAPVDVAVRFVAGSHRWGKLFYPRHFVDGARFNQEDEGLEDVPDVARYPEDYDIRAFALQPGDTVLFDFRTLHGTGDAIVRGRRRAFSTRWLGDDVRYVTRSGETSPPFPDIGLKDGDPMREDWFPVLWRR